MSKSYNLTTRAVVVARRAAAEGSVRAYFYTEEFGLVGAFAKSGREERSKLRAHLQVSSYGHYTLVRSVRDTRVTGAVHTTNSYFELAHRPFAQTASSRVLSVVRQLVHGEEQNSALFEALWGFLTTLPALDDTVVRTAEHLAVVRMLSSLGYVPHDAPVPHLASAAYDPQVLNDVAPLEKQVVQLINTALVASNLS